MQLTRMSGQCGKPSVRRRWSAAFGAEVGAAGRSPLTASSRSRRDPAAPSDDRALVLGADHHEADAGVARRGWQISLGCSRSISSRVSRCAALGQRDQAEPARGEHDRRVLGGVPTSPLRRPRGRARARPRRRPSGPRSPGRASGAGVVLVARVGERAADRAQALVRGRRARTRRRPERALDQLVELVP